MRVACLTTALALTSLAIGGAVTADAKKPAPRLSVAQLTPLEVRGTYFRVRERVRLTVSYNELQRTRVVRASRTGSFVAVFTTVPIEKCGGPVTITALGGRGSRATTQVTPPSLCPPPPP